MSQDLSIKHQQLEVKFHTIKKDLETFKNAIKENQIEVLKLSGEKVAMIISDLLDLAQEADDALKKEFTKIYYGEEMDQELYDYLCLLPTIDPLQEVGFDLLEMVIPFTGNETVETLDQLMDLYEEIENDTELVLKKIDVCLKIFIPTKSSSLTLREKQQRKLEKQRKKREEKQKRLKEHREREERLKQEQQQRQQEQREIQEQRQFVNDQESKQRQEQLKQRQSQLLGGKKPISNPLGRKPLTKPNLNRTGGTSSTTTSVSTTSDKKPISNPLGRKPLSNPLGRKPLAKPNLNRAGGTTSSTTTSTTGGKKPISSPLGRKPLSNPLGRKPLAKPNLNRTGGTTSTTQKATEKPKPVINICKVYSEDKSFKTLAVKDQTMTEYVQVVAKKRNVENWQDYIIVELENEEEKWIDPALLVRDVLGEWQEKNKTGSTLLFKLKENVAFEMPSSQSTENPFTEGSDESGLLISATHSQQMKMKTFINWLNYTAQNSQVEIPEITDLTTQLMDGKYLALFLEIFLGEKVTGLYLTGLTNYKKSKNISVIFRNLKKQGIDLTGIKEDHIIKKNVDKILELIWLIIKDLAYKEITIEDLFVWAKSTVETVDASIPVRNFDADFHSGLAFNALLFSKDQSLTSPSTLNPQDMQQNLQLAFQTAETNFGIPQLLDPADFILTNIRCDYQSIMTYLYTLQMTLL
ncbi:spectrin/filamin related cytoskeletal protein [Anaeramoeba flamelloides]|uniref:Spectrin/filamin related cytoskeletal protein n=1 Tax=Anaeramoeba flamelloides TaxID=1746091 RepID=A0AAV8A9P9_9EUKA|nr:spectrin/filamin related cytoskeletal protein [Anaeramoeba flamelloides]